MQSWPVWKNFQLKPFLSVLRRAFVASKPLLLKNKLMSVFFFCLFVLLLIIKRPHNMVKVLCIHWKMLNCEEKKIEESARKIHTRDMKNYLSRNMREKKI